MYRNLFFLLFMGIWVVSSFYKCCPECSYLLFGTDMYVFLLGVFKGVALPGDGVCSALVGLSKVVVVTVVLPPTA